MGLVLLEGQDIVRPAGAEVLGDRGLAAHGIDRYDAALQFQQVQQPGNGGNLMGLGIGLPLAQDQLCLRGPGADHMQRGHPLPAVVGAAGGLAVNGDHFAWQQLGQRLKPRSNASGSSRAKTRP